MASHHALAQSISRNAQVPAETNKLARYLVQRAIPNFAASTNTPVGIPTSPAPFTSLIATDGVGYNSDSAVVGGRTYKFRLFVVPDQVSNEDTLTITLDGGTCRFEDGSVVTTSSSSGAVSSSVDVLSGSLEVLGPQWVSVEGVFKATSNGSFGPKLSCSSPGCSVGAPSHLELTEIAQ